MTSNKINEIIREAIASRLTEVDAIDFFNGLNKQSGGLTPWDAEGKMERMRPSNAARSKGSVPTNDYGVIRGYNDWRENFKQVMNYPQYCQKFGVRR